MSPPQAGALARRNPRVGEAGTGPEESAARVPRDRAKTECGFRFAWVLTAYLLSASIMTPILGRIGDMTGKKRVFVAALVALAVGSLLAAVGAGLGIVLAGPIVDALDYHWLFWLPLILTVMAAVAAVAFVPESAVRTPGRIAWLPAVLLSGWLVALLVALSEAPVWGWGSGRVIGLLAGAVLLAVAWVAAGLRAATPLIDMKMMRRTAVWTNNLVALLIGVGMYATFAFLPEFVQTPSAAGYGFGASITRSGLMLLPSTITMFAVGMFAGRLTRALGGKVLVIAGCLIGCAAMTILAFAHAHEWEIYLSNAIMGVGFGLAFSAMSALVVAAVPSSQTGVASGMNANIRTIGGSIGMAGGLALAALAGLLIPRALGLRGTPGDLDHAEMAMVAGGTVAGDQSE